MNHDEAILLLEAELLTLRGESYEALVRLIGKGPTVRQRRARPP